MSEGTVRVTRATAFIDDGAADTQCNYYAEYDSVCASIGGCISIHGAPDDVYLTLVKAAEAVRPHITEGLNRHLAFGWPDDVDGDICDVCGKQPAAAWLGPDVHACAACTEARDVPADEQALRDEYEANPPRIVQAFCSHAGHLTDHERLDDGRLRCLECGEIQSPATTTKVPA